MLLAADGHLQWDVTLTSEVRGAVSYKAIMLDKGIKAVACCLWASAMSLWGDVTLTPEVIGTVSGKEVMLDKGIKAVALMHTPCMKRWN
jgi:hypothetical protein